MLDENTMCFQQTPVFVLDMSEAPAFAFAAENLDAARHVARSDWLLRALDSFCHERRQTAHARLTLRTATDDEAALYRDRADEFAEEATRFFIAHLL